MAIHLMRLLLRVMEWYSALDRVMPVSLWDMIMEVDLPLWLLGVGHQILKLKNVNIHFVKHALFLSQRRHLCQVSQKGLICVLITPRKKFIVILKITYTSFRVLIAVTKLLVNQSFNWTSGWIYIGLQRKDVKSLFITFQTIVPMLLFLSK